MTRDSMYYEDGDSDEPFVLADRGTDLARFYELAYQIGDHWISLYAHMKRALHLFRAAAAMLRERLDTEHPESDPLATIEMASLFPYFEERFRALEPLLDEILAITDMDDMPTMFAVDSDTPRHHLRRNYSLMMAHLVHDRIKRTQQHLMPLRLFDLCRRSEDDPSLEEVAELYQIGESDAEE